MHRAAGQGVFTTPARHSHLLCFTHNWGKMRARVESETALKTRTRQIRSENALIPASILCGARFIFVSESVESRILLCDITVKSRHTHLAINWANTAAVGPWLEIANHPPHSNTHPAVFASRLSRFFLLSLTGRVITGGGERRDGRRRAARQHQGHVHRRHPQPAAQDRHPGSAAATHGAAHSQLQLCLIERKYLGIFVNLIFKNYSILCA